jgi:pimeloyl-ACP methyl ester carboxylesterase
MAKGLSAADVPTRQKNGRAWADRLAVFSMTILLLLAWFWIVPLRSARQVVLDDDSSEDGFYTDWDDIPISETLRWVPCFRYQGDFLCARLTVPMDYSRPLSQSPANPKVHIAMVLLPGAGHSLETGLFSESPLLINPGGPGGSGAEFVLGAGPALQIVAGRERDIIGFDPRGIGNTVPKADCFIDGSPLSYQERNKALMNRLTYTVMGHDVGLPNSSSVALQKHATRLKLLAKLCLDKDGEEGGFRYLATPHVARDMKSIVEAWDQWIEEEGLKVNRKSTTGSEAGNSVSSLDTGTKGKLVYWGFSYGTLLGATFAAMFRKFRY